MPRQNEKEFLSNIKQGISASLFVFFGPDEYSKEICVNKLISAISPYSSPILFDGQALDMQRLHEECCSVSFFSEDKCVVLRNPTIDSYSPTQKETFDEIISQKPDTTCLIIVLKSLEIDLKKSSKWANFIKKVESLGVVIECAEKTQSDAVNMILNVVRKNNCTIDRELAKTIAERSLNDMLAIDNNLVKLCAYASQKNNGVITYDAVDNLTVRQLDHKAFELVKQLIYNNAQKALEILGSLFNQQVDAVSICAAISSSFVDIYRVKLMQENNHSNDDLIKNFDYKGKEYKLKIAGYDSVKCSLDFVKNAILVLSEADLLLKSTKDNKKICLKKLLLILFPARKIRCVYDKTKTGRYS